MSNLIHKISRIKKQLFVLAGVGLASLFLFVSPSSAAVLSVSPSTGSFVVGSTFTVSVLLNSENQSVNTVSVNLLFPSDRLQLVSPSTGNSIISLWTALPYVDNQEGKISMQGGIPNGIQVSNGLVTSLVFRVKAVGGGYLKFADSSRVLLNDGQGTEVLRQLNNAVFSLTLPPPAGPIVASPTHPDQATWYSQRDVLLNWTTPDQVDAYSYILNDQPIDYPDDIPEGLKNLVQYYGLSDGIHYFHVKALHNNAWGGTTHFAIKIDTTPPAKFITLITPNSRTTQAQPVILFSTTDALSGMDHYELRLIPLRLDEPNGQDGNKSSGALFIEASSPYIPSPLKRGSYDVVVRAYDAAANFQEVTSHLAVVSPMFQYVGSDGLYLAGGKIAWPIVLLLLILILLILTALATKVRKWHTSVHDKREKKELPSQIKDQLQELKKYRSKYGMLALLLIITGLTIFAAPPAHAASITVSPPVVTTISKDITNNEIFYLGGKNDSPSSTVVIYIQNLETGETISETAQADLSGQWFYRHDGFLYSGNYRLWVQTKVGDSLSPPSPEQVVHVRTDAIQVGVSRISFEALYLILIILALITILALSLYVVFHIYHGRRKHRLLQKEIREAQESVKRGFAILRHDVQSELEIIRKAKLAKDISAEESIREEQLLKDLQSMEAYIGKEIWDVEKTELASN